MKSFLAKFLVLFYSLGTVFLPMGDFSAIGDLPKMYEHCKTTEDIDMTPLDFITDHLINFDGIFDKHLNDDDQKPHNAVDFKLGSYVITLIFQEFKSFVFKTTNVAIIRNVVISNHEKSIYSYNHIFSIFHPPIFA